MRFTTVSHLLVISSSLNTIPHQTYFLCSLPKYLGTNWPQFETVEKEILLKKKPLINEINPMLKNRIFKRIPWKLNVTQTQLTGSQIKEHSLTPILVLKIMKEETKGLLLI